MAHSCLISTTSIGAEGKAPRNVGRRAIDVCAPSSTSLSPFTCMSTLHGLLFLGMPRDSKTHRLCKSRCTSERNVHDAAHPSASKLLAKVVVQV